MIPFQDRVLLKILDGPTPLEPMKLDSTRFFMKRDDVLFNGIGGNKARKLEFILGDLKSRNISELVSFGAWGSNHLLTTAICASKFDFKLTAHVSPQPLTNEVEKKFALLSALARVIPHSSSVALGLQILRLKKVQGYVYPGASSPLGSLGYVKAAFEFVEQIKEMNLQSKKIKIVLPLGTGGTVAGLLVGLAMCEIAGDLREPIEVLAVQVVPIHWNMGKWGVLGLVRKIIPLVESDVGQQKLLMKKIKKMLKWAPWDYRPGYGRAGEHIHQTIEQIRTTENVTLDPTYSGKAMHRFLKNADIRNHKTLGSDLRDDLIHVFWNTYPDYLKHF